MTPTPEEARALVERLTDYTPGPWDAALERGCHGVIAQTLPEGGANFVAIVGNDTNTPEKEPSRFANARLIAAAPDLHAALTAMVDEVERLEEGIRSRDHALNFILSDAAWTPKHPACESIIKRISALRKGDGQ